MLKSHGWTVNPGGTAVCQNAGSGANQCGPGIPAGTKLAFNLIYDTSPATIGQQVTDLASQAKKVGINIQLQTSNFNFMIANYLNPTPDAARRTSTSGRCRTSAGSALPPTRP